MSSESIGIHPERRFHSSNSDAEDLELSQVPAETKPKQTFNQFCSWKFCYTIQTDLLGEEGVSTDKKKLLLTEHLQTRLDYNLPPASSYYFLLFSLVLVPPPGVHHQT